MLADRIGIIPPIMIPQPDGFMKPTKLVCHQAVFCWLHKEVKGTDITTDEFCVTPMIQAQVTMSDLAKKGDKLKPPKAGSINLTPGTILIFTDTNGIAKHSCVVRGGHLISGYNQQSWFKTPGYENEFSNHGMGDIKWNTASSKHNVFLSNGAEGNLIAVDEQKAVNFFIQNF